MFGDAPDEAVEAKLVAEFKAVNRFGVRSRTGTVRGIGDTGTESDAGKRNAEAGRASTGVSDAG